MFGINKNEFEYRVLDRLLVDGDEKLSQYRRLQVGDSHYGKRRHCI